MTNAQQKNSAEKTIFQKIIGGEIPAAKFYEDDICIGIVDKFPTTRGQVLIIPKQPTDYLFDFNENTYIHLFTVAKKITAALDEAFHPIRTCMVVEGFEVPHAHIKLFPVYERVLKTDGGSEISSEEAEEVSKKVIEMIK